MENLLGKGTGADVPCVFNTNTVPATSERGDESDVTLNQAITALNRDELDQAAKLAMLSLRQDPTNLQAAFVARIIDRERQLHPAE